MLLLHDLASANVFQEDIEINFHEKITWFFNILALNGVRTIAPKENCSLIRIRVWVRVRVKIRVGGGAIFVVSNCPRTVRDILFGLYSIYKQVLFGRQWENLTIRWDQNILDTTIKNVLSSIFFFHVLGKWSIHFINSSYWDTFCRFVSKTFRNGFLNVANCFYFLPTPTLVFL